MLLNELARWTPRPSDLPPLTIPTDLRSPGLKVNRSVVSAHCCANHAGGLRPRLLCGLTSL